MCMKYWFMVKISPSSYLETKPNVCIYSLLQLHQAENQGTLWLFLISRKEVLLTGKTPKKAPNKNLFMCVTSQIQVKQRELVRDCEEAVLYFNKTSVKS